ncbi:hypothetical protein RUND412_008984 [Rhizina undulata]
MSTTDGVFDGIPAKISFIQHLTHRKSDILRVNTFKDNQTREFKGENIISLIPGTTKDDYRVLLLDSKADTKEFEILEHLILSPPKDLLSRYEVRCLPEYLKREVADVHVLVSTGSGTGLAEEYYRTVVHHLELKLAEVFNPMEFEGDLGWKVHKTVSVDSVRQFTEELVKKGGGRIQTVLLLSGDAALWDMVNVISHASSSEKSLPRIVVIPFPLGTGNAISSSYYGELPALWHLLHGESRRLPIFRAKFSPGAKILVDEGARELDIPKEDGENVIYGAVVASWGFHATLVADSDSAELRKHGRERFHIAAREGLTNIHTYQGDVELLDESGKWKKVVRTEEKGHFYTLLTNVSNLESNFKISPHSKPFDGELRVVHFPVMGAEEVMGLMTAAYNEGKHIEDGNVGYEKVLGLRIRVNEKEDRWRRICVDGAIVQLEAGGWVEVGKAVAAGGLEIVWGKA